MHKIGLIETFKDRRKDIGITQEVLSELSGVSLRTLKQFESGKGNHLELFTLLREYVPSYIAEAPRLLKLFIFNYLFSNGDAHYKNFSLQETQLGDYRLSPAYDLLNSRIHVDDQDFALNDGLLPRNKAQGKIREQFILLSKEANIPEKIYFQIISFMLNQSQAVEQLIAASFLNDKTKRNYLQAYQRRLNRMSK